MTKHLAAALAAAGCAALTVGPACAPTPDPNRATVLELSDQPDFNIFKAQVNQYLENKCASLDCHGQPGRGYRIYSFRGLRIYDPEAKLISGLQPTTDKEIKANFEGLITLEPEEMRRVINDGGANPERLLILRKPMQLERHKGGPVMARNDSGYKCIVAWLSTPNGGALSQIGTDSCTDARQ
jgi:hypothetical protein